MSREPSADYHSRPYGSSPDSETMLNAGPRKSCRNHSVVIGISKATQLTVGGRNILGLTNEKDGPHLIDISSLVESEYPPYPLRFLGRVYVAKLSSDGFLFRTDIDRESSQEQAQQALERLAGLDVIFHGYPETLRIAHIFSTFTANEILAV